MGDKSAIEWTDATWNPIVGCSIVSPGCTNCYAMKMAARIERMTPGSHYAGLTQESKAGPVWTGKLALAPDHILTAPLHWEKPRKIFVNSMGDLFHDDAPDEWIDKVFAVMALAPQHTFQVLTKRSKRMREYLTARNGMGNADLCRAINQIPAEMGNRHGALRMPLPNVELGVSAEDQPRADERIPDLLATPAAVRFVSAEPLLGPIDFTMLKQPNGGCGPWWLNALSEDGGGWFCDEAATIPMDDSQVRWGGHEARLDWIIAGGESGPGARPIHPDWARSIRDQCAAASVPFFFKQWGEWEVALDRERDDPDWRRDYSHVYVDHGKHRWLNLAGGRGFHGERFHVMRRVGKRRAGRLLDGVEHNAFPEPRR